MNERTKESKFLDAINKYAESQKAQIAQEIEDYKNTKIEQATEQGLKDAYELIKSDIANRKAAIVNETAKKELEMRRELFEYRQNICDEVFAQAEAELKKFVSSDKYAEYLRAQAQKVKELFKGESCTVFTAPENQRAREIIAEILPDAQFKDDSHISIGGMRAYCRPLGITADCTLDAGLETQKAWFIENSGLKVV